MTRKAERLILSAGGGILLGAGATALGMTATKKKKDNAVQTA